jgi:competence ComEA-like helix-hairpin-helix protein
MYTRQQLVLLLLLVVASGAGLAVSHWRTAHPELVERLERIDRESPPAVEAAAEAIAPRPAEPLKPSVSARRRPIERPADGTVSTRPSKRSAPLDNEHKGPLDLNEATLVDLTRLPGVGPVLARRIVDARDAAGRFAAVDDLATVRGLGRSKLERLRPFVAVLE